MAEHARTTLTASGKPRDVDDEVLAAMAADAGLEGGEVGGVRGVSSGAPFKLAIPAPQRRWPTLPFTDPSEQNPVRSVCLRYTSVSAATSTGSPSRVPVPCAST